MATFKVKAITVILLATGAMACSKQQPEQDTSVIQARLPQTIQSKVSMTAPQSGSGLILAWQSGDQLYVNGNGASGKFTIMDGFTAHEAQFEGQTIPTGPFTVLYPGQKYSSVTDIYTRSYEGQVQKGNGSTAHLEWNTIAEKIKDYTHLDLTEAKRNGVLELTCQLPENSGNPQYLSISTEEALFYKTNDSEGEKTNTLKLSFQDIDLSTDHNLTAYMMTSWNDVVIPAATKLNVLIYISETEQYKKKLSVPSGGVTIKGGMVNVIRLYQGTSGNFISTLEGFIWSDDNFWN